MPSSITTASASCSAAVCASATPDEDDRPTSASRVRLQSASPASTSSRPPSRIESPIDPHARWIVRARGGPSSRSHRSVTPLLADIDERLGLDDGSRGQARRRRDEARRGGSASATGSAGADRRSRPRVPSPVPAKRTCAGSVSTGTANGPPRKRAGPVTEEIRRTGTSAGEQRYRTITSPGRHEPSASNRTAVAPSISRSASRLRRPGWTPPAAGRGRRGLRRCSRRTRRRGRPRSERERGEPHEVEAARRPAARDRSTTQTSTAAMPAAARAAVTLAFGPGTAEAIRVRNRTG